MNRRNALVTSLIVLAVAVAVGIGLAVQSDRDTTGEHGEAPKNVTSSYGVLVGDADAPKSLVIYEDFQCPACEAFEAAYHQKIRDAVEAGSVNVEFRIVSFLDRASLNEYSSRAANAALVVLDQAGTDEFWTFHDLLYADQPREGTEGHDNDELIDLAVEAGADRDLVEEGIEDGWFDQWVVNATDEMSKAGVSSTPTVLVDGEQATQETLDAALAPAS